MSERLLSYETALPGEPAAYFTDEQFAESSFAAVQEYALLVNEQRDLGPDQRPRENWIDCELDRVTGVIRAHIKWAQNRGIETSDLERILQP